MPTPPVAPAPAAGRASPLLRTLDWLERAGNRLPDPLTIFVVLAAAVVVASALASAAGVAALHPGTGETVPAVSLVNAAGVRRMLVEAVRNFTSFPPLGIVLVAMLGIGVAERSGLVSAALRQVVGAVPRPLLTATVVFAGVNSSIAADAGIVVLVPLGAAIFAAVGRHPIAGLAAAFAGVSGGFSANLLVTSLDPLLAGLTEAAARLVDVRYAVRPTANYYFMVASVFLLTAVGTLVTTRIVEPRLGTWTPLSGAPGSEGLGAVTARERRGLWAAAIATVLALAGVAALALPDGAVLRDAAGSPKPFFDALVLLLSATALLAGVAYGIAAGTVDSDRTVARMAAESMATMAAYVVLAFAAAQFVAYFSWSNLGVILAVEGAAALKEAGLGGLPLLAAFMLVSGSINLLVASSSAKWAVLGPVFVPMLMLLGFSPEVTQAAYRVGDSSTNLITPLMPYFPLLIAFGRRYDERLGLGTLLASMLPYSIAFGLAWTVFLLGWVALGIPLGPGAPLHWAPAVAP